VNKAVLSYISALVGFLRKIVTSVPGYEKDKITFLKVMMNIRLPSEGNNPSVAYV
jgi:hypothetical protein